MSAPTLSLEDILTEARLPEREVTICLDGTAVREHEEALRALSLLVDGDGNVLATGEGDVTDADIDAAQAKADQVHELRQRVRAASHGFRFRAMSSQDCEAFERRHRRDQGKGPVKDQRAYEDDLIATCAISPALTVEEVSGRLRTHLNQRHTPLPQRNHDEGERICRHQQRPAVARGLGGVVAERRIRRPHLRGSQAAHAASGTGPLGSGAQDAAKTDRAPHQRPVVGRDTVGRRVDHGPPPT